MTIVATLRGVSKKYGATTALHPTDLDLRTGVTGLLGPTGPASPRCSGCSPPRSRRPPGPSTWPATR